ncbi:MAG: helix-turn-helix domain-containing protein [Lachnospiraceae bacterium]|nr:helix-turn-helix domain-containing protein [Lachnospiraceae bacterium]MCM1489072.1 helix-turn-helix domain-containing protein [Bacillota bacterium]
MREEKEANIPIWEKLLLTTDEAMEYTGIGRDKLRELSEGSCSDCVVWIGRKRLFKRKKLEEYLEKAYSI